MTKVSALPAFWEW